MAADLAAMVRDAVAVVPHGAEVQMVEFKGTAGDQFEAYLRRWDKAILKVIMGQTLTAEMDGPGSRAAAETHYVVAEDMAEADQYMMESTLNELATIYRDINAPGVEAPVFGYHEPDDYEGQADLDNKLYTEGVRFKPGHFELRYGLNPEEFSLQGEGDLDGKSDADSGSFAENESGVSKAPDHQDLLGQLVEAVSPQAARQNQVFVDRLLSLLDQAKSFQDVQLLLAEHLGQDMDMQAQENLLADLMAAADLMGRAAVKDEG